MKTIIENLILIQQITKNGLLHCSNFHDKENYEKISLLSKQILENISNAKISSNNIFLNENHVTPSISVRTLIFKDNKILMVKEKDFYSLPGGWCELYESVKESAIREVKEEAGLIIDIVSLVGILNIEVNNMNEYAIFFKGEIKEDLKIHDQEVSEIKYFDIDKLPKLSPHFNEEKFKKIINASLKNEIIIE